MLPPAAPWSAGAHDGVRGSATVMEPSPPDAHPQHAARGSIEHREASTATISNAQESEVRTSTTLPVTADGQRGAESAGNAGQSSEAASRAASDGRRSAVRPAQPPSQRVAEASRPRGGQSHMIPPLAQGPSTDPEAQPTNVGPAAPRSTNRNDHGRGGTLGAAASAEDASREGIRRPEGLSTIRRPVTGIRRPEGLSPRRPGLDASGGEEWEGGGVTRVQQLLNMAALPDPPNSYTQPASPPRKGQRPVRQSCFTHPLYWSRAVRSSTPVLLCVYKLH